MSLLNYRRVVDLSKKLAEMTELHETRRLVEKAKLIMMKSEGLEENEAYEKMRKRSMDTRSTMRTIAEEIILKAQKVGKLTQKV
jgi:Response regulator with putative antiterminator output domain